MIKRWHRAWYWLLVFRRDRLDRKIRRLKIAREDAITFAARHYKHGYGEEED